jgi:hypothetical protein
MSLNVHMSQCCAIQELSGLSSFASNPKGAMKEFCRMAIAKPCNFHGTTSRGASLYSFYLFTAAIETPAPGLKEGRKYPKYGQNFAAFIKSNGLGDVWESPLRVNEAFHSDHSNQVYIWMPDHQAVFEWWERNKDPNDDKLRPKPMDLLTGKEKFVPSSKQVSCWQESTAAERGGWYCSNSALPRGCGRKIEGGETALFRFKNGVKHGDVICKRCAESKSIPEGYFTGPKPTSSSRPGWSTLLVETDYTYICSGDGLRDGCRTYASAGEIILKGPGSGQCFCSACFVDDRLSATDQVEVYEVPKPIKFPKKTKAQD